MCYWVGTKKVRKELYRIFQENPEDEIAQLYYHTFMAPSPPREEENKEAKEFYVAIGKANPELTVLVNENNNLQFKNIKWGLKWSYTNKEGKTYTRELLNSTCEKVFWQHKDVIYTRRCAIPIDGYIDFHHHKGDSYPYFLHPKEQVLLFAGGIWDSQFDKEKETWIDTFSIITTPPNELAKKIHNNPKAPSGPRMLLLLEKNEVLDFLNPRLKENEIKSFLKPYDAEKLMAHPIIKFLKKENSQYLETEKVREPFNYPGLELRV